MNIVRGLAAVVAFAFAAACGSASTSDEPADSVSAEKRIDPCAAVRCMAGHHCQSKGKHASCVVDPTCTAAQCGPAPAAPTRLCPDGVNVSGPGPCTWNASTKSCGWTWVTCPEACPIIDCAAPPPGCHYEGAVFTPCDRQTCGSLVCDGSNL